jgi:hypothetical protein
MICRSFASEFLISSKALLNASCDRSPSMAITAMHRISAAQHSPCYFIWGGQALFGFPITIPQVNRTMGLWGFWMPGFMQFITGVYLLIGLTWFNVFGNAAPLYMAGLAFTAVWHPLVAMAHRRYIETSAERDDWMAIAFLFISILGVDIFRRAGDIP